MNNPPITELSIALQFEGQLDWKPLKAIDYFNRHKDEFPNLEFKVKLGALGGPQVPILETSDDLVPRYWYVSSDECMLVQVQNDLVAMNWRRRPQVGEAMRPYPGFEDMKKKFSDVVAECLELGGLHGDVPVSVCNLYYDNVWPSSQPVPEIFTFWKALGIAVRQGPQVSFSIPVTDPKVGGGSKIDVTAGMGGVPVDDTIVPSARIAMAGYAHPGTLKNVWPALDVLHEQIGVYLPKLVSDAVRESWS
tara:strand:+ start:540 stop:1286 length:747 start_codon:yes stop_codon:yes gene_type:complete